MTDNGTGQRAKGRRECELLHEQKENQFCVATQRSYFYISLLVVFAEKKRKFLSLQELPPANAEVKCTMHGRMRVAGREEGTQMLMQAL